MILYSINDKTIQKTWLVDTINLEFWFVDLLKPYNPSLNLKTYSEFLDDFDGNKSRVFDGPFIQQYTITVHDMGEFK